MKFRVLSFVQNGTYCYNMLQEPIVGKTYETDDDGYVLNMFAHAERIHDDILWKPVCALIFKAEDFMCKVEFVR